MSRLTNRACRVGRALFCEKLRNDDTVENPRQNARLRVGPESQSPMNRHFMDARRGPIRTTKKPDAPGVTLQEHAPQHTRTNHTNAGAKLALLCTSDCWLLPGSPLAKCPMNATSSPDHQPPLASQHHQLDAVARLDEFQLQQEQLRLGQLPLTWRSRHSDRVDSNCREPVHHHLIHVDNLPPASWHTHPVLSQGTPGRRQGYF